MILNREEIKKKIREKDLIKNYIKLKRQLTPNGFDLTVEKIFELLNSGKIDFTNEDRKISDSKELEWDNGWVHLKKGTYKVRANEIIKMPLDLIAISFPRSSLLRSGVNITTGVWDAGFEGKSEFMLSVGNENGFKIKKNARIIQLLFIKLKEVGKGYNGVYKSLI